MAYPLSLPVDDLSCSVCHDIFKDPVLLSCSHSFSKDCLESWWTQSQEQQCPLCKRRSSKAEPPSNLALKNLSKAFQQANADLCPRHAHIELQTAHTERHIKKEFKKLHQFLQDEEESRITALRDEEQLKGQKMKKEIEELSRQIETLSNTVTETEKQLGAGDISFLKNYKATAEKAAQPRPLVPALPKGALMDVAKHLGNLVYAVWKKLEENVSYIPVILDANTAGTDLHLSEDLTSVRCGARQQLPENPERLEYGMLGSGFPTSASYNWEVEVGDSTHWELGVSIANYRENTQPRNAKAKGEVSALHESLSPCFSERSGPGQPARFREWRRFTTFHS
ncbi:unnamed protein product [Lota lota]